MKNTTIAMLCGSVIGGALVQLGVLACGSVAATPDARAAVDVTMPNDAGTMMHAGFSYHSNGFVKKAGTNRVIVDILDYNTFTSASYNVGTGTFSAPLSGYYRFNAHGFSPTPTPGADTRISIGFDINDHGTAISGGQLSQGDTPLPYLSHVIHLNMGDRVNLISFTTIDVTFGATDDPDHYYFQGEYLGQ
jgi:hypothetical protein